MKFIKTLLKVPFYIIAFPIFLLYIIDDLVEKFFTWVWTD